MTRRATNAVESVGNGPYQRVYVPSSLAEDSTYPFEPGDNIRLQLVSTTCGREVLAICSDGLEIDPEESAIEVREAPGEQLDLELKEADS